MSDFAPELYFTGDQWIRMDDVSIFAPYQIDLCTLDRMNLLLESVALSGYKEPSELRNILEKFETHCKLEKKSGVEFMLNIQNSGLNLPVRYVCAARKGVVKGLVTWYA